MRWTFDLNDGEHTLVMKGLSRRPLSLDGRDVRVAEHQHFKSSGGMITDWAFTLGPHAYLLRQQQSRWMGNPQYVLIVDGAEVPLRRSGGIKSEILIAVVIVLALVTWAGLTPHGWWMRYGMIVP